MNKISIYNEVSWCLLKFPSELYLKLWKPRHTKLYADWVLSLNQTPTMVISKFLRSFKIRIVRVTLLPKAHKKTSWSIDWTPRLPFTNLWGSKQILEAGAPTPQPLNQPRTHPHYQVPTEDHRIRKHSTVEAFFSHTLFFCKLYNNEELSILLFSIFCQFVVRSWILAGDQQLFSSGETFVPGVIRIQSIRLLSIVIQTRPDPHCIQMTETHI